MAVKIMNIWIYSFSPIDLTPIIAEFCAKCRSSNLRIEDSVKLDHYDDIAPGCQNKIQRMTVVHSSISQAKREIGIDLKRVASITIESQQADSFHVPAHDFRTLRHTIETSGNFDGNFIPIVLHYDSIDKMIKQARLENVDMVGILRKKGFVEDVRGKEPKLLARLIFDHIAINQ